MEADIAASFVQISSAANLNENLKIFIHKYAAIQYTSHITSAVYKRSQSRDSSFIKVQFAGGEEENGTHAGVVQYYARAKLLGKCAPEGDQASTSLHSYGVQNRRGECGEGLE